MTVDDDERRRLGLATELEYTDPVPEAGCAGSAVVLVGPWWQRLEGGLARVRTVWRQPLRVALEPDSLPDRDELRRWADRFLSAGAIDRAILLYLDLSDDEDAARTIARHADHYMNLGQWESLDGWLARLPRGGAGGLPGTGPHAWRDRCRTR